MSTADNKTISVSRKVAIRIGYFFLIAILIILFWVFRNIKVDKMISAQQQQVSQTIINTVNEQAKLDLMMPDIVFINMDSANKKKLNETISKQIATVLTRKYLSNQQLNPSDINLQPFFVFPDSADREGNYTLTKNQLIEFKNHIQFLTAQVDKAVLATKEEINKEIDKINTWVSIWIGVLSIFGTIIPLFYNYKNNEDLMQIKEVASDAKTKAENADKLITKHQPDLEKIEVISSELGTLKESFNGVRSDIETAKTTAAVALIDANSANATANRVGLLVATLNDLSKIKDIDANFLLYNNQPFETLRTYLFEIHFNLTNCSELYGEAIIRDVFRQLALKLYLIAPSGFINPNNYTILNQFAIDISVVITVPITQDSFNNALALLHTLNTNLTND
jgi:hypothetical protein